MVFTCERCKAEVFKYLQCGYCGRSICNNCIKSSKKITKINRIVICKSCWSDMKKRSTYKNRVTMIASKLG